MKLYIPTSSRNFNCLFSEESISPKSFYGERGFGYSKWHSIPENPYDNLIVLYDGLKCFERPDEGFDDYPLVVEVTVADNDVENLFYKVCNGAYLYDGTLYFNPSTTGFIFFNEQHKRIVLSKSEGSLETKLVQLYNTKIRVERASGNYIAPKAQDANLNRKALEKSIRINKVKGFIYGYHIGSLLSVSKEQGLRIKKYQTLLDLTSAIYSSIDKTPTAKQRNILQKTVFQNSSLSRVLLDTTNLDAEAVSSLIDKIVTQCKWMPAADSPDKALPNLYSMILNPETQGQTINNLTSWINKILETKDTHIVPERAKEISVSSNDTIELPVLNNPDDKATSELWINGELADNKYKGSLASFRLDLATELTKSVRDNVYKDRWETSSAKHFLNALRRNLNGEEFTEKWGDDVLSSIAAVLMKGDTWEGLRSFLISKGIQNQAMPFAFYGIINGFANLPKDFTNVLLNNQDSENLQKLLNSAIYEAINGLGMEVTDEDMPDFLSEQTANEPAIKDDGLRNRPVLHEYSSLWDYCVRTIEETPAKKKDEFVKYYSTEIEKIFESQKTLASIKNDLKGIPSPRGTRDAWNKSLKAILDEIARIEKDEATTRMRKEMIAQPTLWASIIDDPDAANYVGIILEKSPIRNAVVDNFKHIQKEYQPGGYYYERNDSRENSDIIDHFDKWCFSDKNTYKKIQRTPDNVKDVKRVVDFLKQKYHN